MVYYYGWDRLDARTHLAVGWVYFASAWASLAVIAGILAFMLTSGDWVRTRGFVGRLLQPHVPADGGAAHVRSRSAWPGSTSSSPPRFLKDADLKARVARWSATRWIAAGGGLRPARAAVVPLGRGRRRRRGGRDARREVGLARRRSWPRSSARSTSGHPIVRGAARVAVAGTALARRRLARPRRAAGPPLRPPRGRAAHGPRHRRRWAAASGSARACASRG